jgi:alpha-D-ribose 1-methylphosphonate 5-triphosphate diphosphatase
MPSELVLTNAKIVTADAVVGGALLIRDGLIAEISEAPSRIPSALDLAGDYLLPGLVELHTDNLEKHVSPRPGVRWPMQAALLAHDAQVASAGITTVFDALTIADIIDSPMRAEMLHDAARSVGTMQRAGLFRAEHLLHMRCEVSNAGVLETVRPLLDDQLVRLVSLMDHTPGQRQFTSLEKYAVYYKSRWGYSDAEMEALVAKRRDEQVVFADRHRREIAALCAERNLPTASHDDATVAHIEEALGFGMTIAEFPTTIDAAVEAHRHGMAVVMGAPNVVRGGSHSGNVSASDLAQAGVLDVLSSDYVPFSLLHSAFLLHRAIAMPLPEAIGKISVNPARVVGLADRGEIAPGQRADLIRAVLADDDFPVVRQVWRAGARVV